MTRRAKLPLNPAAASAADQAVGKPSDDAQAAKWLDSYEANGGEIEDDLSKKGPVDQPAQCCPKPTIDLVYLHSDGTGVAGAKYHVYSVGADGEKDGHFEEEGTLNGEGRKHIADVPDMAQLKYSFSKDPQKYEIKPEEKTDANPDRAATTSALDAVGEWIWGTVQGDFNKDQSISQIAVNTVLGLIPIVDQVLDIRDIIAGLKDIIEFYMEDEKKQKKHKDVLGLDYETWLWVNVFIIAIGCIPEVGSVVKGVIKGIFYYLKRLGKVAGELNAKQLQEMWELSVKILNKFGVGNAHGWLKELPGKLDGWMSDAAKNIKAALDAVNEMIDKAKSFADLVGRTDIVKKCDEYKKAVQKAYDSLDKMKTRVNTWIKDQVNKLIEGKHVSESTGSTGTKGNPVDNPRKQVEADPPNVDAIKEVDEFTDILSPEARQHILHGDGPGSGGHLWPGQPGKTPFPEEWSGDKIIHEVGDITTSPSTNWHAQTGNGGLYTNAGNPARWRAWEVRDGVRVRVVYEPATGKVITAFPDPGPASGPLIP